ncbi:hypothetical protein [Brumimicrobium sp.]|uniref:hypothetical protein n=1 Tax=Brumimicrobium sp. TaxID=2029867 RepID=UPI003A9328DA
MSKYYAEEYSFPVIGYQLKDGKAKLDNIFGTASYMNNNVFVSAAHSIKNAQESEFAGIAFRDDMSSNTYTYHYIKEAEIFEDFDIGIFTLHNGHKNAKSNPWSLEKISALEDVYSMGFPHGYEPALKKITTRAFKGHIVTSRQFDLFPTEPDIYELSFHCPKGISGASLKILGSENIVGFVIGNSATEIVVFSEKEIDESNGERTVYERVESTKFGIAISIQNLMDIKSNILGGTFREYLLKEQLLK